MLWVDYIMKGIFTTIPILQSMIFESSCVPAIYSECRNKRNEVIVLSKRKLVDVLLAVFAAICMVADTVHHKDSETKIE